MAFLFDGFIVAPESAPLYLREQEPDEHFQKGDAELKDFFLVGWMLDGCHGVTVLNGRDLPVTP